MMMKYKQIIGGTKKEAEKKFSWLKDAEFSYAIIDITKDYPIWIDGTWIDGFREGGIWEDGKMWSNIKQRFVEVKQINGIFKEN